MMTNALVVADKMLKSFIKMIDERKVSLCGVYVVSADDLLYLLSLWKNNLAVEK
jgi:hypothetical protein